MGPTRRWDSIRGMMVARVVLETARSPSPVRCLNAQCITIVYSGDVLIPEVVHCSIYYSTNIKPYNLAKNKSMYT